ncbi:MAG: DUF502 domain-containing protein [Candidatus Cyclonatronum sp.]|uniref:DUF502 domain-containing protein n=1 Tax=Cyclonatronum sp. TaxID=3024185 RepID=UPI0025BFB609|nr:DUF502 domain-containing protein [Cyclonatronum sp.]MCC5934794.1 DUF502 domain-containing protein [Balneolales bacterium]MCH8486811.1 DUF502 domain-containing protein [Cyclonatronum sp.]
MKNLSVPKTLLRYFLQGLLYIAPLAITFYILIALFLFIDGLLRVALQSFVGPVIPGLGFLASILVLILLGYFGQTFVGRPLKTWLEGLVAKIPILNIVYSAFSDLFSSLIGTEKKFNKPVLVLVNPVTNLEKMGFLTEEDLHFLNEREKVAVYFPHSYNFSGEMFIVPATQVRPLDLPSGDVMKFIVSGGVAGFGKELSDIDRSTP